MKTKVIASIGILLMAGVHVSQAISIDLTTVGSTGTLNGCLFETTTAGSTGTGVFQPFLDLTHDGSAGPESAYNSSTWTLDGDNHRDVWNSDLLLADLMKVTRNSVDYYLFTLDANEPGNGSPSRVLSIDQIKIYQSNTGGLDPGIANLSGLGSLIWDMDAGVNGDSWLKIDSSLGSAGSGDADLNVYVPASLFDTSKTHVYFFNQNGAEGGSEAGHAGFEEWSALSGPGNRVPDGGATILSLGLALLGLGTMRKLVSSKN